MNCRLKRSSATVFLRTLLVLSVSFLFSCTKKTEDLTFTFNLPKELHSLDPLLIRGTAKRFLLFNLHRGLYFYDQNNKLKSHGAQSCNWKTPQRLNCLLSPQKFSDGSPVLSSHYIHTYQLIKNLKIEAQTFLQNIESITATSPQNLEFKLKKENPDFLHQLTNIQFTPRKEQKIYPSPENQVFSGPYQSKKLDKSSVLLENNPYFDSQKRPLVKGIFVYETSTALHLYESGRLSFLRYLETSNIKNHKDVFFAPFIQLDGLMLNPKLNKDFRKQLALSLDFSKLQKIFFSPTQPGCVPLPQTFFSGELPCLDFDKKNSPPNLSDSREKLHLAIPTMSSDDHNKFAQWAIHEWKENLNLNIDIQSYESKVFYQMADENKFLLYRRSIPLDEINCSAAKAIMAEQMELTGLDLSKNCDTFFKDLLNLHIWIPLGLPYFAHLPSKRHQGYYINMLGQFGLENLKVRSSALD